MTNPMSDYSKESLEFVDNYNKENRKADPRLAEYQYIVQEYGEHYERAYQLWNTFYAEAYRDLSYYLGNQWTLEEMSYLNNQRRSSFTYNKIRRVINLVQGYQRKNRLATVISPVENSSEQTAELLSDVMQFVMNRSGGYESISDAFKGSLTSGMSFLSPYIDYRNDPISGDIKFHKDDWNGIILDPFFTKKDLSDCSFVARRKFLTRTEVISLLPEKEDEIMRLPYGTSTDDKFTYLPYARQNGGMQKMMNYNEYWKVKWETKDVLVDMETGETKEWSGNKERLRAIRRLFPQIEVVRKPVRSVDLGIIVGGELLYYGKDPYGLDDYPFVPFLSIFEPSYDLYSWKIQSLVRILRDPQTEINKRRSKMVDILDSQMNSGWIAKTNSVSNPQSLFKSGQGQVIFMKPESNLQTDLQRLESPGIHPSMFQLEAEFEKDIMEIAGVNSELFGMAENENIETAGVLSKMRQSAGLVNLQDIFDGLRESQALLGQKTLKLIQKNYTPEKVKLITKKEPTPEFYSQVFSEYDVAVQEGILTDTQKQTQFVQLLALKASGVAVPDDLIIENSNLHNKKALQDHLRAQAQAAQQAQQMQMQLAMEQQAVITESAHAKAFSDQSLGAERLAKVQLDKALNAERISRAEEDRTAGVLNLVKAAKELDSMDLSQLQQKVEILRALEGDQKAKEAANSSSQ